jgi:hypothetical protein
VQLSNIKSFRWYTEKFFVDLVVRKKNYDHLVVRDPNKVGNPWLFYIIKELVQPKMSLNREFLIWKEIGRG